MLRDILLEAMAKRTNVNVVFESRVSDLRELHHEGERSVEILDESGSALGRYDLIIDAMGLHSTFRHYIVDDKEGKHYTGSVMMHGVINDPEAVFSPELLGRFSHFGTYVVMGKGYGITLQRFGGGLGDNRTSLFYSVPDRQGGDDSLFAEIGIEKPSSRKSGIISDAETLLKVKTWIKQDMAHHFDPVYHQLIDCLDRITIRGDYSHGDSTLREGVSLPLVCIGDSLRNCGLGGGGILAMQDANEVAQLLGQDGAFDVSGQANMGPLRKAQIAMLEKKAEHMQKKDSAMTKLMKTRDVEEGKDANLQLKDFVPNILARIPLRIFLRTLTGVFKLWYRWDQFFGGVGSGPSSPIYPNVKALI
jgi:2-polyprenyl-6-methoxyphenol hydroxylase-like FAD-dependent oxidoreductase